MNIKPIESFRVVGMRTMLCEEPEVRELEANYKEAIEVLVDEVRFIDRYIINVVMVDIEYNDYMARRDILTRIIKKATGKKWEELVK